MKAPIDLNKKLSEITAIADDILRLQTELAKKGINASHPEDREAMEIVSRMERYFASRRTEK